MAAPAAPRVEIITRSGGGDGPLQRGLALRHEAARFRHVPPPIYDVPSWFDAWFDSLFPEGAPPSYQPQAVARTLGVGKDVVYRALATGSLEGVQVGTERVEPAKRRRRGAPPRAWLIPRPALRLWLLERNVLNLEAQP